MSAAKCHHCGYGRSAHDSADRCIDRDEKFESFPMPRQSLIPAGHIAPTSKPEPRDVSGRTHFLTGMAVGLLIASLIMVVFR